MAGDNKTEKARDLLEKYLNRTGITGNGDASDRYLWTDAFAVQGLFGLHHISKNEHYKKQALQLIDRVHEHLGSFHPDDSRKGRISGLSEEEATLHPTMAGLRIGKKLHERRKDESYNAQLEGERDGQYFHYLTQWIHTLLLAHKETSSKKFSIWALELMLASENFIYREGDLLGMYWKMDTTLSRPTVDTAGAHDALEGMICAKSIQLAIPERADALDRLVKKLEELCRNRDWATSDPLGIGGLLLNTVKAAEIVSENANLISAVKPKKLLEDSLYSLQLFAAGFAERQQANRRLAFREGGLSLGVRTLCSKNEEIKVLHLQWDQIKKYLWLAKSIEDFWLDSKNQEANTWKEHLDINAVTLACSLTAIQAPEVF